MLFLNLADMQLIVSALLVLISSYMVVSGPMRSNLHDRRLYNRTSARLTTDFDQDEGLFGTFDATQGLSLESVLKNGSCYDGDYRYSIGETFKLHYDPCRQCVCTKRGVQCSVILCPLIPDSCIAVERSPHQCCVRCVKEGCNFDNETFHVGEIIRVSNCFTFQTSLRRTTCPELQVLYLLLLHFKMLSSKQCSTAVAPLRHLYQWIMNILPVPSSVRRGEATVPCLPSDPKNKKM